MEKQRASFQFAGSDIWFTCDADKLEVTIAKSRADNRLTSTHEVTIVGQEQQVEETLEAKPIKSKKQNEHADIINTDTPSTDNSTDGNFNSDTNLTSTIS